MTEMRKLESVVEFELAVADGSEPLRFKIEVYSKRCIRRGVSCYIVRVFRYDLFRVLPTFPTSGVRTSDEVADHEILVSDTMFDATEVEAIDAEAALDAVVKRIKHQLVLL